MNSRRQWSFVVNIATGTGDTELLAAPTTGTHMVQGLTLVVTTAAAQAFDVEDDSGSPVELVKAPASLAVGTYEFDFGWPGIALTAESALQFDTAAAGVGVTISGYGWTRDA